MKCLTVCQPWASCIVQGPKRIENRTWPTSYRGELLIHAGKSRAWLGSCGRDEWPGIPAESTMPFGQIIGVATLYDCVRLEKIRSMFPLGQPFAEGPWCWLLRNVRAIEPIAWTGSQGLYDVPESIVAHAIQETPK